MIPLSCENLIRLQRLQAELRLLTFFVAAAEWMAPGLQTLGLRFAMQQFSCMMLDQLDMIKEATRLRQFSCNFKEVSLSVSITSLNHVLLRSGV